MVMARDASRIYPRRLRVCVHPLHARTVCTVIIHHNSTRAEYFIISLILRARIRACTRINSRPWLHQHAGLHLHCGVVQARRTVSTHDSSPTPAWSRRRVGGQPEDRAGRLTLGTLQRRRRLLVVAPPAGDDVTHRRHRDTSRAGIPLACAKQWVHTARSLSPMQLCGAATDGHARGAVWLHPTPGSRAVCEGAGVGGVRGALVAWERGGRVLCVGMQLVGTVGPLTSSRVAGCGAAGRLVASSNRVASGAAPRRRKAPVGRAATTAERGCTCLRPAPSSWRSGP